MIAPHPFDEVFAGVSDPHSLAQQLVRHPLFLEAVANGSATESQAQEDRDNSRPHPGPGPGQMGRVAFFNILNQNEYANQG